MKKVIKWICIQVCKACYHVYFFSLFVGFGKEWQEGYKKFIDLGMEKALKELRSKERKRKNILHPIKKIHGNSILRPARVPWLLKQKVIEYIKKVER